ncbi:MAG: hypothetical protein AAFP84_14995 [Actinomycetota bacterium]
MASLDAHLDPRELATAPRSRVSSQGWSDTLGGDPLDLHTFRRVERELIAALKRPTLPTMRELASATGMTKRRLRRAIRSVPDAVGAIVDERVKVAHACTPMNNTWHPSLEVLGGLLVTHRLFVYRIVADVLAATDHIPSLAEEFRGIDRAFADELRFHIRRRSGPGTEEVGEQFLDDLVELFALDRVRTIDRSTTQDLEGRLNLDLLHVFNRYGAIEYWNEHRHEVAEPATTRAHGLAATDDAVARAPIHVH